MGEKTKIPWCDHTFNAWWGCTKLIYRQACDNCYAADLAKRYGWNVWGVDADRRFLSEKNWQEPLKWDAAAKKTRIRRRVFAEDMGDLFEARSDLVGPRMRLFELVRQTVNLDWLFLTKRIDNAASMLPAAWTMGDTWPENVWMGITIEDQEAANAETPKLIKLPARIKFLSIEPCLENIQIGKYLGQAVHADAIDVEYMGDGNPWYTGVGWIIIGCESGPHRRPTDFAAVRNLLAQGRSAGIPVFVKQLEINGHVETDPKKWPEDLRVQEFPEVKH